MVTWNVVTGAIPTSSNLIQEDVDLAKALTLAAADYWGRYIDADVTLTIELRLGSTDPVFGNVLKGSAFSTSLEHVFLRNENGQKIMEPGATHELRTGVDPNGSTPDIVITLNPEFLHRLALDPTPETAGDIKDVAGPDLIDFMGLMIHELGHSLGMTIFPVDTPLTSAGSITTFDRLSQDTSDGRFFFGEAAQEVLGAPVPITGAHIGLPIDSSDDPFADPDTPSSQLFQFDVFRDATYLAFRPFTSSLDLAILSDLGVTLRAASDSDDHLYGYEREPDRLRGLDGNDTLEGLSGADALWGGAGDDILFGGNGRDTLGGGTGHDFLVGDSVDVVLPSSFSQLPASEHVDVDILFGGSGNDVLIAGTFTDQNGNGTYDPGEAGTDQTVRNEAWAGPGDDTVIGTDGSEVLGGSAGDDLIEAHGGNDQIYGGHEPGGETGLNDRIDAGAGDDTVFAAAGNDSIHGGEGDDLIFNGAGADSVWGGEGDDTLWGGPGDDIFTGGDGSDIFAFGIQNGTDTVTDFTPGEDLLDIRSSGIDGIDGLRTIATDTAEGLLISYDGTTILLQGLGLADLAESDLLL